MEKEMKSMDDIKDEIFGLFSDLCREHAENMLKQEDAEKNLDYKGLCKYASDCFQLHNAAIGIALLMERIGMIDEGTFSYYVKSSEQWAFDNIKWEKRMGI